MLMQHWYALQIRPKYEHISETGLQNKGYEVFLPTYKRRLDTGSVAVVDRPLFPGYLFCRMLHEAHGPIVTTPGVMRILGAGGCAAVVDDREIEDIRFIVNSDVVREPWQYLPAGCLVQVKSGPLQGLSGHLISVQGNRRIVVSISILQRSVAAVLDANTSVSVLRGPEGPSSRKERMAVVVASDLEQGTPPRPQTVQANSAA